MPLVRISPKPGVNGQLSQTQNADGWFSSNRIRWKLGLLEKLGGWLRLIQTPCAGYIRALHGWLDLSNNKNLLIGTDAGAQLIVNTTLYSLTLVGKAASGGDGTSFANFSVTIGTKVVTVAVPAATAANIIVGELFTLLMPVSIGGQILPVLSTFEVTVVTATTFKFNMLNNATYTESNAVGIPRFQYGIFPPIVDEDEGVVTFRAHGQTLGSTFHVDQTTTMITAQGFILTIPGGTDLEVSVVVSVDRFGFDFTPFLTGGAGPDTENIYEGTQETASGTTFGTVINFGAVPGALNPNLQFWYLDNLGEVGLLVYSDGGIYAYVPPINSGTSINVVGGGSPPTAPQVNRGMLVAMPQAQVVVWGTEAVLGSGQPDPLLLRFSDAGTYDTWTATASNQAGSYRLSRGSQIVGAIQAPQTTLLFTDVDVWSMSYQGPPLVYGFTVMGSACGLASPRAVCTIGRTTYWLGQNNFWTFSESGVKPLPCPVWDFIFSDLDRTNIALAFMAPNSGFNEWACYFPSTIDAPEPETNRLTYSQQFGNDNWFKVGAAITAIVGPDGSAGGALVEDTTTGFHECSQIVRKDRESLTVTFALYAKSTSTRWLHMVISNAASGSAQGSGAELHVNPIAGSVVSAHVTGTGFAIVASGTSTDAYATGIAGNGWLRYYITVTTDSSSELIATIQDMKPTTMEVYYLGNGTGQISIWGAMLNEGGLAVYEETTFLLTNNPTRYVKYNVAEGLWDYGLLQRTAWLNDSIFGPPLGGDSNFRIQQHEQGYDDDDVPMENVFAETGYGTVSDGSKIMLVDQCQPDMKWFGNDGAVTITLKSVRYPGGPQQQYGPYSVTPTTQFFSTRVRSKQVAMRYDWAPLMGYSARIGSTSFRVKPAGSRP